MQKVIFFGLTLALFLVSCHSDQDTNKSKDQGLPHPADSINVKTTKSAKALTIDTALLNKYVEAYQHDTISFEKAFYSKLLGIIKDFNGKGLDTTILTIGNIDDDNVSDTIFSRVYYDSDSIVVDSKWVRNNSVMWSDKYADPYLDFDSELLQGGVRSDWVIFAVGIVYGAPDIHPRSTSLEDADVNAKSSVYDMGASDLRGMGIKISNEDYKKYLQNFKGDLLALGQPESRERLWVWYKPAGKLITYYQP